MVSGSISHYRIIKKLGAGGMGEVYLAQDTTELERTVAIKIVRAEKASDKNRLTRFIQEAKTASSFNHPNILTIHEIGEADSKRFIVMEFIDGETLRQRLARSPLDLGEVLSVAIQIASALVAAHKGRVVHRDLKPENIMLRWDDGLVKVLDFGLAKPTEAHQDDIDTEAATKTMGNTAPGMIVGTVLYMSPEQARGLEVDARTDLWSLGVLLYEMVTGKVPFLGDTKNEVISAILSREQPAPLARFTHDVPDRLEEIVTKALAKDREERYQTAKDLLIDLKRLKQKLEVDAEIERSVAPEGRTITGTAIPTVAQEVLSTGPQSIAWSTVGEVAPASSAEYIVREIKAHRRGMAFALSALVLISIGIAYYLYSTRTGTAIDSIAVLPLVNVGNDPNTEYLSDGLSESLINSLAQLRQLRVIARTTAFRYKGSDINPQAVGRELNVRAVLTGQVRQMGDNTNIQVDLVDATTGAQLWGEKYERKSLDVLSVKQAVAREVTEKLRLRLSGDEQQGLERRDTTKAEAYQAYLRGRHFWNSRTAVGIRKAIEQFEEAIHHDSNYALAYVGLADCYIVAEEYIGTPATETVPKARLAAARALQLDDSLAEAHASLARVHEKMWEWAEAGKEYERAISLNPNYPTARHWYSIYLRAVGQLDEAAAQIKRAQELDPLSAAVGANVAEVHMLQGEFDAAIEHCKKIIELYPNYPGIYRILATTYLRQGRYHEAIQQESKALELSGRTSWYLGELGYCQALAGNREEARAILSEMEERFARREANAAYLAMIHAALGDKDKAFAWLEKDFQSRAGTMGDLAWDPYFDLFRNDPRYANLLKRIGLRE